MTKNEAITTAIKALHESTIENRKKGYKSGAPISAVIFNVETGEILCAETNDRAKMKARDSKTHAERKCLKSYSSSQSDKLEMIVTINPCPDCLKLINNDGNMGRIYYFVKSSNPSKNEEGKARITKFSGKTEEQRQLIASISDNYNDFLDEKAEKPTDNEGNYIQIK